MAPMILNMHVDRYQAAVSHEDQVAGVGIGDDHSIRILPPVLADPKF